ncbi:MAG: FtsH protease activity modulator HflK [Gammaproteobacteria bacterium]|nr:FtsH protease activity modulator HflK [Gammaproteobacteria bacterium]MDH5736108.1 FtsH protease activity modulator HflK [Gammaproteobacteria bacterium]
MAWNEPGGNKNQNPWGNRGNDQGPPDLDEVFRKFQEKLNSIFGGKGSTGSGRGAGSAGGFGLGIIVLIIVSVWMLTGFYKLEDAERGIILRFGKHVETTQKGLHWHWPVPIESVTKVNVSERQQFAIKATMLTQDENIVDIEGSVQYQISDASNYVFNVRFPETTLAQATESALRQVIGRSKMDFIMTEGRDEVASRIKENIQEIIDQYGTGISVFEVNIQDANPPQQVRDAFQDVTQAREDRERLINESQAYRNEVIPKARGQAARLREEADGYKQEVVARSEGEAQRFSQLLKEYIKAPTVTRDRLYLDTVESVLSNSSKIMIDVEGGNNLLYLPLDKIIGNNSSSLEGADSASVPLQRDRLRSLIPENEQRSRSNLRTRETR